MSDGQIISIVLVALGVNSYSLDQKVLGFIPAVALFHNNRIELFFFFFLSQTILYYKSTLLISKIILVKRSKAKRGK